MVTVAPSPALVGVKLETVGGKKSPKFLDKTPLELVETNVLVFEVTTSLKDVNGKSESLGLLQLVPSLEDTHTALLLMAKILSFITCKELAT